MIIAIDGPAASGKGTLSRRLAEALGFAHLDTGKLYRAVGYAVLQAGGDPADPEAAEKAARALDVAQLSNPELTLDHVADAASKVAAIPGVRKALLDFQRNFAKEPPGKAKGAVLDGRDIGTVICPDAPVKFFVTADVEIRAQRRHKELLDRGEASIYARVLEELQARDERDRNRADAPMRAADDAVTLDTSAMTPDAVLDEALRIVEEKRPSDGSGS